MNRISCKSFKEQLAESLIEGNGALISEAMNLHKESCKNCSAFYMHVVPQFKELEKEKNTGANPYLANKILLKTSLQKGRKNFFPDFVKTSVSLAAIIVVSLFIGIGLNSFFYPAENDTAGTDPSITTTIPAENSSDEEDAQANENGNQENNTLTLNE